MEPVPDLTGSLRALHAISSQPAAPWTGPRHWWEHPAGVRGLDVEGLALASVRAAATALNALTGVAARYSVAATRTAESFDSLGHLRIAGRKPEGFAPLSGFRRTADGWIRLHANYPHHAARLMNALEVRTPTEVDDALRLLTSSEAEDTITANNGVAAAVRTRDEWLATPMRAAAGAGPWISFTAPETAAVSRPSSWSPSVTTGLPLASLRVLDLTRVIAGPTATRLLGALGADVLRIDPPRLPELPEAFIDSGFDKRSAVADLGSRDELTTVRRLIEAADVVVTGYRGGGLDRFGLSPEELLRDNPGLIVVTLSAWGVAGPWRHRRGFDSLVQAACGIAHRYGSGTDFDGGWTPGALPVQALDHATGYGLAAAVLGLLAERLRSGAGGSAALSLAGTAEELFRLSELEEGSPHGADRGSRSRWTPQPDYRELDSFHGRLRFVGPPILVDGVPLDYRRPPVQYGSSKLGWE
ncbi:CoA transferase [Paenarthrobacter sp. NPDC089322]|uniref:CoA transferase n=1 Tax=Paenarthrobacter sp. NPDC089322 TaxID=3155065 RepID=UPI00344455FB